MELWLTRDPIPRLEEDLRSRGVAVDGVRAAAEADIAAALERARAWEEPGAEARLEDVLA